MGSFRAGMGFTKCPKCEYECCIVDVWDRDYEGMVEQFYCLKCNHDNANLFLRQYIDGKLYSKLARMARSVGQNEEEKLADTIIELLNFDDDGSFSSNELLKRLAGLREFKLEEIFDFKLVRKKVLEELKKDSDKPDDITGTNEA